MKLPAYIYEMRHNITGKAYIGRSANVKSRVKHHLALLRAGRHPVALMQNDFNLYGEHFTVSVLDTVTCWDERGKEVQKQIELKTHDPRYGYNYRDPARNWIRE